MQHKPLLVIEFIPFDQTENYPIWQSRSPRLAHYEAKRQIRKAARTGLTGWVRMTGPERQTTIHFENGFAFHSVGVPDLFGVLDL